LPAADLDPLREWSRINLRKNLKRAIHLPSMFMAEILLFRRGLLPPSVTLLASSHPAVSMPAFVAFEPAIEFAQPALEGGIDLAKVPEPVAFDFEFEQLRSGKYPSWLPVAVFLSTNSRRKYRRQLAG
jgi:hypothetical protein